MSFDPSLYIQYGPALLNGFLYTVLSLALANPLAILVGLVIALLQSLSLPPLRWACHDRESVETSSLLYDLRHRRRGRGVAAALHAHCAFGDHHPNARQISTLNAFEHSPPRRMLGFVDHHEGCGAVRLDQSAVKVADSCGIARSCAC